MDNSLFDRLKQAIPLENYLTAENQCLIKPVGDGINRANPCFACGHNDCLTLYADNTFHCFSCSISGDVINAEQILHSHESQGEAARRLAEKYNIDAKTSKPPFRPSKAENKKDSTIPKLGQARAFEIRRMTAEFYHAQLLNDPKAQEYLTSKRKHSAEILNVCQVGYASGNLIKHAKSLGYTVEDLKGVGLVKPKDNGVRLVIPQGAYVFPHYGDGEVCFFTFKDPAGKLKYQLNKEFKDPGYVCLGQDCLTSKGPVVIVEGENDYLSVVDKGKWPRVIATNGNANTTAPSKHIKENCQGWTFYLAFDNDQAGDKYTRRFAAAIHAANGQAFKLEIPSPHKDIDEYLRSSENPEDAFQCLIDSAKILQPASTKQDSPMDLLAAFKSFEILGEDKLSRIVMWSRVSGKVYTVGLRDLRYDQMIQIGGEEVAGAVSRKQAEGKIYFDHLKRQIILRANKTQLGDLKMIGQGVHYIGDDILLVVNGSNIYTWEGGRFQYQDIPLSDGKVIEIQKGWEWIDFEKVRNKTASMDTDKGNQILTRLANLFSQWGFEKKQDHILAAGWSLAQVVQTSWKWRPHLWVTGPQGSGKTSLIQFFEALGGRLSLRHEGQSLTEAGFRQSVGNDSRLCMIDEFEQSQSRERLIEIFRSAGRGGTTYKGTTHQQAVSFQSRHMVLLASIEKSLPRAADNSRFLSICTKKDPTRKPKIPDWRELEEIRTDMVAYALWAIQKAKKAVAEIGRFEGVDNRFAESVAVPYAMLAVSDSGPKQCLQYMVKNYLEEWKQNEDETPLEDEESLVEDILTSVVQVAQEQSDPNGYTRIIRTERTVSQALAEPLYSMNKDVLEACGVKRCEDGVFLHHTVVANKLLKDTKWHKLSIGPILKRVEGVKARFRVIARRQQRGYVIPWGLFGLDPNPLSSDEEASI
ncbi:Toprim-like [Desulfatibacillum alkenivorans DSM 16219]|jgi:5S rRNA maturation endonuclease (ribonuclease M5)|uniref:Toprim-like n=1 Tax=Desulfatibacillum alkenivorans DSM 16219 TaxID=1121393 RepID=A0A1M6ZWV5_9BACT|nr:toprim domain-containing protein [Desulfatibacillum alkenivorans]SHL34869.1 Toprim-like [Desulfatibacillum alkenivorans DSM 16219]